MGAAQQVKGNCIDSAGKGYSTPRLAPVILAGDEITVEENRISVEARLRGVALETAQKDTYFKFDLKPAATLVRAVGRWRLHVHRL